MTAIDKRDNVSMSLRAIQGLVSMYALQRHMHVKHTRQLHHVLLAPCASPTAYIAAFTLTRPSTRPSKLGNSSGDAIRTPGGDPSVRSRRSHCMLESQRCG
jgi:hypothetical protein